MKTIRIFLASSITQFEKERYELAAFIYKLGETFREAYGIDVKPFICEDYDHYVTPDGRMQDEFNKILRESEMVFFLFYTRVGEYTEEEFRVALEQMRISGDKKPKIYTFFKALAEGETIEDSLREFMGMLENTLGHYHESFTHIDTVKLRILLNLKAQELDFVKLEVKNGGCTLDGREVLPLKNVAEFVNNGTLQRLQQEYDALDREYREAYEQYVSGPRDTACENKYAALAARRIEMQNEIEALEESIFEISLQMSRDDVHGEITKAQQQAYRLFEQGRFEEALSVLDGDFEYWERKMTREREKYLKTARIYVRIGRQKIRFLAMLRERASRFAEIDAIFKKIVKTALDAGVETDAGYAYVLFLKEQNRFTEAIALAEQLCKNEDFCARSERYIELLQLTAALYRETGKISDAEALLLQADKRLNAAEPKNEAAIASVCEQLGIVYSFARRDAEAERAFIIARDRFDALNASAPGEYDEMLAAACDDLGNLYRFIGRYAEAEQCYLRALKIRHGLAEKDPYVYLKDEAGTLQNLGVAYSRMNRFPEARARSEEALKIYRNLKNEDPGAFLPLVALVCGNLANIYDRTGEREAAYAHREEALAAYRVLAKREPAAFLKLKAYVCYDCAVFCKQTGRQAEAQARYEEALEDYRILEDRVEAAKICNDLGILFFEQERFSEAEEKYQQALAYYRDPETKAVFKPVEADIYYNLATVYYNTGRYAEAEKMHMQALRIRYLLAAVSPETYEPVVALSLFGLGMLYSCTDRQQEADEQLAEALEIANRHPEDPYCAYILSELS